MLEISTEPQPVEKLVLATPNILKFEDVALYFKEFYQLNQKNPRFTYRKFAEQINWPYSYLNDLAAGRKPLTISRALEFSKLIGMTVPETERFIVMSLKDSENAIVSDYFSRQFNMAVDLAEKPLGKKVIGPFSLSSGAIMLFAVIAWIKKPVKIETLEKLTEVLPQILAPLEVRAAVEELVQSGVLKMDADTAVFVDDAYFEGNSVTHQAHLQILMQIFKDRAGKNIVSLLPGIHGYYRNGMVEFPVEHMEELQQRLMNLANWIGNINRACRENPSYTPAANPLIKFDLCFTHLIARRDLVKALEIIG